MGHSYSDGWNREGHQFEKPVRVKEPVYYRHVYAGDGSLVGVIVDYELADDCHFEFTAGDWQQFSERCLCGEDELPAFRAFLDAHPGLPDFENALNGAGIAFVKIAF